MPSKEMTKKALSAAYKAHKALKFLGEPAKAIAAGGQQALRDRNELR